MHEIKRLAVYCGSASGNNEIYVEEARKFGKMLANNNIELVYGGGHIGIMGAIADAVLENGGKVTGVITKKLLDIEIGHTGIQKMQVVDTMHQRKAFIAELSDAMVALPGGFGTLDEFCEIMAWNQLRIIDKPIGILNTNFYFESFLQFLNVGVREGFVKKQHRQMIHVDHNPYTLLEKLKAEQPKKIWGWWKSEKEKMDEKV